MEAKPATVEELRERLTTGIGRILNAPRIIQRFITQDDKDMLRAQGEFWQTADAATLQKVLDKYKET